MKIYFALAFIFAASSSIASAAPTFEDYPSQDFTGKAAKIRLHDAQSKKFASVLTQAARRPPDFAGRYVLASWGCGASCIMTAAIDSATGAVAWLPFTVCCWEQDVDTPLEYQKKSHLLIVHGSRNEVGGGVHYYKFDGKNFILIDSPASI